MKNQKILSNQECHKLILDAHYAIISVFFNGNSLDYINYFHKEIKKLSEKNEDDYESFNKIEEYAHYTSFILTYIPTKIKWNNKQF